MTIEVPAEETTAVEAPATGAPAVSEVYGSRVKTSEPIRVIAPILLVVIALIGFSMGQSLTSPGTDSWSARLSGWARDHHLGTIVNSLEKFQYNLHKPKTGGTIVGGIPIAPVSSPLPSPTAFFTTPPPPIKPLAPTPLAGEGVWQPLVLSHGVPAIRETFFRPDSQHTSYLTSVAWMDQKLLRFTLHPGVDEPGHGPWSTPDSLSGPEIPGLAAAFNSGFKLDGARGGYYSEGRTVGTLRDGAASIVIYRDGYSSVGQWGRDFQMNPNIVSVRQNLDLLVDNGKLAPTVDENNTPKWGFTLGNKSYVWRSGIGITRSGALIYAAGNALNVRSIGQVLLAAGAVRAMELDINPAWTTYYWFEHLTSGLVSHKLSPDMQKPPDRYLKVSSRDFFAVHIR